MMAEELQEKAQARLPLSRRQREVLDRRLSESLAHPEATLTWSEVQARLEETSLSEPETEEPAVFCRICNADRQNVFAHVKARCVSLKASSSFMVTMY